MMELIEADEEKKMLMKVGFFGTIGFGKTPAVVIIDIQKSHTDPTSPLATPRLDEPIRNIKVLIKAARKKNVPIGWRRCHSCRTRKEPLHRNREDKMGRNRRENQTGRR